jgi:hypothetical protein
MQTEYERLPRESLEKLVQAAASRQPKSRALSAAIADGHEALAGGN